MLAWSIDAGMAHNCGKWFPIGDKIIHQEVSQIEEHEKWHKWSFFFEIHIWSCHTLLERNDKTGCGLYVLSGIELKVLSVENHILEHGNSKSSPLKWAYSLKDHNFKLFLPIHQQYTNWMVKILSWKSIASEMDIENQALDLYIRIWNILHYQSMKLTMKIRPTIDFYHFIFLGAHSNNSSNLEYAKFSESE